jgi:hypothetical protein
LQLDGLDADIARLGFTLHWLGLYLGISISDSVGFCATMKTYEEGSGMRDFVAYSITSWP